jgi:serine phosphatase RsbU (regulator of sigma subunit)/methylmalonyl-CoA mutase cobalamin-binding subunit
MRLIQAPFTMQRWNVIVAALEGHDAAAEQVSQRLRCAWTSAHHLTLEPAPIQRLSDIDLSSVDVVIVVGDRHASQSTTLPWLTLIEEAGVPMLALVDGPAEADNIYEFAGALVESRDGDDRQLCAVLHGLLHRQKEVKNLRAEVAVSQRFHGGLKGEIAKMHEELQLAAIVQREFLPREAPSLHGMDFAALWRPTNYVSGDIYDLMRLDEDHVGVFIADAVGHGVPAALMTMVICRSLVTKEIEGSTYRILPPSEVLARLNLDMIRRQGRTTRFATAVYAVINCRTRTMQLAGAGHPPPLILSADGSTTVLETSGGLLGVFADESYPHIDVELSVNDRLLLYTDGFEQAFPAPQGEPSKRKVPTNNYRLEFDQLAALPNPNDMVDVISRRLDDQSGSLHQVDDLTLICVQAGPIPASLADAPANPDGQAVTLRLVS